MKKIREADVTDKRGNVVISPGLKVRHKESQFEYTVDSVIQEPDGKITIMLASPEAPRFDSNKKSASKKTTAQPILFNKKNDGVLYEVDPIDDMNAMFYTPDDQQETNEDLLAVPAAEFETEYEIK